MPATRLSEDRAQDRTTDPDKVQPSGLCSISEFVQMLRDTDSVAARAQRERELAQERTEREREAAEAAQRAQQRQTLELRRAAKAAATAQRRVEEAARRADLLPDQLQRWWSGIPPGQRMRPFAFREIQAQLKGATRGEARQATRT